MHLLNHSCIQVGDLLSWGYAAAGPGEDDGGDAARIQQAFSNSQVRRWGHMICAPCHPHKSTARVERSEGFRRYTCFLHARYCSQLPVRASLGLPACSGLSEAFAVTAVVQSPCAAHPTHMRVQGVYYLETSCVSMARYTWGGSTRPTASRASRS